MDKGRFERRDRLIEENRHDVYLREKKLPEPTQCTVCGAVFVGGRWTWKVPEKIAHETDCPACRRIADRYPAGILEIKGAFFRDHFIDISNLIRNVEKKETADHPLERVMGITTEEDLTVITTTGIHLARRLGESLVRAHAGDLAMRYGEGEQSIHLRWER